MSEVKEDQSQQYEQLQEIRQKVHLSSNKLLELTYNDNVYMEKLISYNREAKKLINEDLTQEALIYLSEAERILEYGANCGKSIDRNIIITTLHNEACCFYKQGDLPAASKYLEGVIYNLQSHLASLESSPASSTSDNRHNRADSVHFLTLEKKIDLIHYNLKFCTINSQAKKRDTALDAGKKALKLCFTLFNDLKSGLVNLSACDEQNKEAQLSDLKELMDSIKLFKEQIDLKQLDGYVRLAKHWIGKWNSSKVIKKISFLLEKHINNYSISEVIDMVPVDYRAEQDQFCSNYLNTRTIMRQLLHFSMGYFTVSTEYRLIAQQLYKDLQQKYQSQQFKRANIYHLLSIIFLVSTLNCDLLFVKQVISSYQHHYKSDLSATNPDSSLDELSEKLLFQHLTKEKGNLASLNCKGKTLKQKKKRLVSQYQDSYIYDNKISIKMSAKMEEKLKKSLSKNVGLSSSKKLVNKIINQTILQSKTNKSMSKNPVKSRSVSKDSNCIKVIKSPSKAEDHYKINKKTAQQYQLDKTKIVRKRLNSASSADLSVSCRSRDFSKKKDGVVGINKKEKEKAKPAKNSTKKKIKPKETICNKHYYL